MEKSGSSASFWEMLLRTSANDESFFLPKQNSKNFVRIQFVTILLILLNKLNDEMNPKIFQ